jgi:hypothetical protein
MTRLVLFLALSAACGSATGPVLVDAEVITGSLEITPPSVIGKHGLTNAQLKATLHLSNGEDRDVTGVVDWKSSASATASVSPTGLVHLSGAGAATITGDYKSLSGMVNVTSTDPEMFLTDEGALSVAVYNAYATGDTAPTREIIGPNTTLAFPWSIAVVQDEIFVSDVSNNSIDVWPLMSIGNIAPMRQIKGLTTTLTQPYGMTVHGDEIIVGNTGRILVFSRTGTGNIEPIRTITGPSTLLSGIVTSVKVIGDEIYIVMNFNTISVFPLMGTGDIAPTRQIVGAHTTMQSAYDLAPGANGEIEVSGTGGVRSFPATATGDVPPLRYVTGADVGLQSPTGVLVLDHEIYGLNSSPATLSVHSETATGDEMVVRSLGGAATTLVSPRCIAIY